MPLYEYHCAPCQHRFELMRSMSRSGEGALCPRCGQEAPRAISVVAVFSRGESGSVTALAGSAACSGCAATSCASCN